MRNRLTCVFAALLAGNVVYGDEEPQWRRATPPASATFVKPVSADVPAPVVEPEVVVPPIREAFPKTEPVAQPVATPACSTCGKPACTTCSKPSRMTHPPMGSYLEKLSAWFCYRAAPNSCECKMHPTKYRPPLYTWFPYRPDQCPNWGPPLHTTTVVRETPVAEPVEPKLPAPVMPKYTTTEKPFVPGSAAAELAPMPKKPTVSSISLKPEYPAFTDTPSSGYNPNRTGKPTDLPAFNPGTRDDN
jgi:hypothetical protein